MASLARARLQGAGVSSSGTSASSAELGSGEDRGVGYNGKLGRTGFRGVREFMGAICQ
ncbi:hypothetical protein SAMN05216420_103151 [Nitrosospira sp. Nl5]|nr:hypothetical protein SAMN05216420_103151 [Nitrosospira sp. Nl5]